MTSCPCGLPQRYDACCGRFHRGEDAPTAELLMRSRYTAFAVGETEHLLRTWHPTTRPPRLVLDEGLRWLGLVVHGSTGGMLDATATVRFTARSSAGDVTEDSRFVREDGRWRYVGPIVAP